MAELLNQLFGLDGLGFGAEGVRVGFARPLPGWAWALAAILAAALAWWSYWRLTGARTGRVVLAGLRAALLLLLLVVIAGPQLVRENVRIERDWVLVLVDRSASMGIADVGAEGTARRTREEQLREAIRSSALAWDEMSREREVVWLGFDSGAFDLEAGGAPGAPGAPGAGFSLRFGEPTGRRTSLGAALDAALARAAARPVSGVVVLSDGRSFDEPSRQALRRLQAERVPVVTVPLGSREPLSDLAVERAEAPALAFVRDTVPVNVRVDRLGAGGRTGATVRLIEKSTGRVLDEKRLPEGGEAWSGGEGSATVTLTARPEDAGKVEWVVRLTPDEPDLIAGNNEAELALELVDRPLRVVYFDGYPRWEQRYLKNLLIREGSVRSSALLLAPNRQYLQEGDVILPVLPRSPEEWAEFDVIVMGDIAPNLFTREQLEQIKEHVAVRGAGLLWVAGPGATPHAWRGTALADLLPFAMGSPSLSGEGTGTSAVRPWTEPVVMAPAPAAERLGLLRLGEDRRDGGSWPEMLSDPRTGWSRLHWAQRIDPESLKPAAEVLAVARPASAGVGANPELEAPVVLSMRYGAGRVLYVGTDEIWRWRYARGEALPERFWLPLIRLQGRESLARSARAAALEVTPRRAEAQQPVRVSVTLLDQALLDAAPSSVTVRLTRVREPGEAAIEAGGAGNGPVEITLRPESADADGTRGAARSFAAVWAADEPGRYIVEPSDPLLSGLGLSAEVRVAWSDDEMRRPEADHELLERLSASTEGAVLATGELGRVPELLPRREVQIAGTPEIRTLWDRPVVLALLVLLLTAEWVGRKLIKLV